MISLNNKKKKDMKIIALAGSNSINSINEKLSSYAASLFEKSNIEQIDLNDYEVEVYSVDKEANNGIPCKIVALAEKIDQTDLMVISLAEHNGSYSSAFKNIYDWLSRIENRKVFGEKPILLLATSPWARGGSSVLSLALDRFARDGSEILESFLLPFFYDNFTDESISNIKMQIELIRKINRIKSTKFKHFFPNESFDCGIDSKRDGGSGDASEY